MDQMACAIGGCIEIDFKGSGRPAYKKVNFDRKNMASGCWWLIPVKAMRILPRIMQTYTRK